MSLPTESTIGMLVDLTRNDVYVLQGSGVPSGTVGMGVAGPGSLYIDTLNKTMYQNVGTKFIPNWALFAGGGGPPIPVPVTSGGTGLTSFNQGDLLYAPAANTIAALAKDINVSRYLSNKGVNNNPSWAQVNLTDGITGNLPIGNLGSGIGASGSTFWRGDGTWATPPGTVTHSLGALTSNAIIIGNGSGDLKALSGLGTAVTVLHGNAGGAPSFSPVALGTDVSGNLPVGNLNSGTGANSSTFWRGDGVWSSAGVGNLFINVVDFGAVGDGVTNNHAAIAAAIAAIPATGGVLYFPAGVFYAGTTLTDAAIRIHRSNVTVMGAGIDTTTITYTSSINDGLHGVDQGSCFSTFRVPGVDPQFVNLMYQDFTISDLNTTPVFSFVTFNPAALNLAGVSNVHIKRLKLLNIKGNGGIDAYGLSADFAHNGDEFICEDCQFIGTTAGGQYDWDSINAFQFDRVVIRRCYFVGMKRYAYESGDPVNHHLPNEFRFENNYVNMSWSGAAVAATQGAVVTGPFANGYITDNVVIGNPTDSIAFQLDGHTAVDADNIITNALVANNQITNARVGIEVDGIATTAGITIRGNRIAPVLAPIKINNLTGDLTISDNYADVGAVTQAMILFPAVIGTIGSGPVTINNNKFASSNTALHFIDWTGAIYARPANLSIHATRIFDNQTLPPWNNNQAELGGIVLNANTPSANAGLSSAVVNVTTPGVLVGDSLTVILSAAMPQDVYLRAIVSAADTVTYWTQNQSAGNYNGAGVALKIFPERRQ